MNPLPLLPASSPADRRLRRRELLALVALLLGAGLLFQFTELDLEASRRFFDPAAPEHPWPQADALLWALFYYATPLLTALILTDRKSVV
jgi:hypothetical protein